MPDDPTLTSELEDADERPGFDWSQLDVARLRQPDAWPHVVGFAIAATVVAWPGRTDVVASRLLGAAILAQAVPALWHMRSDRPVPWVRSVVALLAIGLGGLLITTPARTATGIGRLLGGMLMGKGAWDVVARRRGRHSEMAWHVASSWAFIAVGTLVFVFPSRLLSAAILLVVGVWAAAELISLRVVLATPYDPGIPVRNTSTLVGEWFESRPKTIEDRRRLYGELLYEGAGLQARIIRFGMLMVFASVIASMGVVSESTAVVVGAMLIAPLMTPLMAMALSLVMGWPNRLGRSALVVLGGCTIAIGIGFVIGAAEFTIVDTLANDQIVSRSNPTIVDLVIAVAAGAAGAYALSRPDVSNSLPGVAIAIALVPPLTVVGISYSERDWASGNGALLLFLTNALAILVVGGLVFLLVGVAPVSRVAENQYRVRTVTAAVVGAAALVVGALILNGINVASNLFEQQSVQRVVDEWVAEFPRHSTIDTHVDGDEVVVVLSGPDIESSPTADELGERLSSELGRGIAVDLRIRLEIQDSSG